MTPEEALKEINDYMIDEYGCATLSNDALRMAIAALEKQYDKSRTRRYAEKNRENKGENGK